MCCYQRFNKHWEKRKSSTAQYIQNGKQCICNQLPNQYIHITTPLKNYLNIQGGANQSCSPPLFHWAEWLTDFENGQAANIQSKRFLE